MHAPAPFLAVPLCDQCHPQQHADHASPCMANIMLGTQRQRSLCLRLGCVDCPTEQRDLGGAEERDNFTERVGQIPGQGACLGSALYCLIQITHHTEQPSKIVIGRYRRITGIERRHGAMTVRIVEGQALRIVRVRRHQLARDTQDLRQCQMGLYELRRVLRRFVCSVREHHGGDYVMG